MAAYLATYITGNEYFGGYLSVDGREAFAIEDYMTYLLEPGLHHFTVYSKSNMERGAANFQQSINNLVGPTGGLLDFITQNQIKHARGDSWSFEAEVDENEAVTIRTYSRGNQLVDDPEYRVIELSEEDIENLEEMFKDYL